ncbi:MAG TPA: S1/P1 nuclease [Allosphingosinicella sp.]|jgi:hypothetical protein
MTTLRLIATAMAAALLFGWSSAASAWGNSGHRTVCTIAYAALTPTARREVDRLLQADPAILGPTRQNADYGWACTYPDNVRDGGPGRRDQEHYVNYPRNLRRVTGATRCGVSSPCVVSAIAADFATLRSASATDRQRHAALVYLGHWIGDVHQPLHSSFRDDQGGNRIEVSGPVCPPGRYGPVKLHSAWDTCMFERMHGWSRDDTPTVDAVRSVAATLHGRTTRQARRQWNAQQPWQWAAESYAVARTRWTQYCVLARATCRYSAMEANTTAGRAPRTVLVDEAYFGRARPVIEDRVTRAGVRLAHWLNRALDPDYSG